MKRIFNLCCIAFFCSQSYSQGALDMLQHLEGAWHVQSFQPDSIKNTDNDGYFGARPEPISYLWFKENTILLKGSCSIVNELSSITEEIRYIPLKTESSDTLVLKMKTSELLNSCGNVDRIKVISCTATELVIRSFTNKGNIIFQRMSTPDEVAAKAHELLQGTWKYKRSFSYLGIQKVVVPNEQDSLVTFTFQNNTVFIAFENAPDKTIEAQFTIVVTPSENTLSIAIDVDKALICSQIPLLFFESLEKITATEFSTLRCDTDADGVVFYKTSGKP